MNSRYTGLWLIVGVLLIVSCAPVVPHYFTPVPQPRPTINYTLDVRASELPPHENIQGICAYIIFHNPDADLLKTGSGAFVRVKSDRNNVYVLTAAHVVGNYTVPAWAPIEEGTPIIVVSGVDTGVDSKSAEIVAFNRELDVALLKLENATVEEFPVYSPLDIDEVELGSYMFTVGNPLGYKYLFTEGSIASTNYTPLPHVYITSVPVDGGSSGGGLFNGDREISGIIIMKVSHHTGFLPLSAATKSIQISEWLNSIDIELE